MRRGVSLIEMMISVAVTLVIIGAVFSILSVGRASFYINSLKTEAFQQARNALRIMGEEVMQSRTSQLNILPHGNFYNSLTFKIPQHIDEKGVITWSKSITYFLSNNQIIRTQGNKRRILASNISRLRFRIDSGLPQILEIYVTASKNNPFGKSVIIEVDANIKLRN